MGIDLVGSASRTRAVQEEKGHSFFWVSLKGNSLEALTLTTCKLSLIPQGCVHETVGMRSRAERLIEWEEEDR